MGWLSTLTATTRRSREAASSTGRPFSGAVGKGTVVVVVVVLAGKEVVVVVVAIVVVGATVAVVDAAGGSSEELQADASRPMMTRREVRRITAGECTGAPIVSLSCIQR